MSLIRVGLGRFVFCGILLTQLVATNGFAEPIKKQGEDEKGWQSLFDGKTLAGWKVTDFAGHSDPKVEDGKIILPFGSDMTGITYAEKLKFNLNYELELDAMRVDGNDFFCGLTFPVGDEFCTLICGGWGGGVTGLSSIDGMDASENTTSVVKDYQSGKWYHIHLRVTKERIQASIDKEELINFEINRNKLSTRLEVNLSKPLGIATWCTTGAIKNIRIHAILPKSAEKPAPAEKAEK